jgi:RIMS-binding protein 2
MQKLILTSHQIFKIFPVHQKLVNATAADFMFSDLVPAPRHLTLERQLNKSVLIGWNPPDQYGHHQIESYHVYVDGNIKVTVKAAERTRALVEGVDANRVSDNDS